MFKQINKTAEENFKEVMKNGAVVIPLYKNEKYKNGYFSTYTTTPKNDCHRIWHLLLDIRNQGKYLKLIIPKFKKLSELDKESEFTTASHLTSVLSLICKYAFELGVPVKFIFEEKNYDIDFIPSKEMYENKESYKTECKLIKTFSKSDAPRTNTSIFPRPSVITLNPIAYYMKDIVKKNKDFAMQLYFSKPEYLDREELNEKNLTFQTICGIMLVHFIDETIKAGALLTTYHMFGGIFHPVEVTSSINSNKNFKNLDGTVHNYF